MKSFSELQAIRLRNGEAAHRAALGDTADNDGAEPSRYNFPAMRTWLDLLAVAKDHETVTKHVETMAAATTVSNNAKAALKLAADAHEAKVAAETKRLADDRAQFEKEKSQALADLEQRHAHVKSLHSQASADASASAELKMQLQLKLKAINAAASS